MRCIPYLGVVLLGLAGFAPSLQAQAVTGQAATGLSRVPANAALVVHFQPGPLYASPGMKELRDLLAKAGSRGLEVFEDLFQPDSIQLDRITGVVMSPNFDGGKSKLTFAFIVTTRADMHPDHFARRLSDAAVPVTNAAFPTWVDKRQAITFALPEPRLCILGTEELVDQLALAPKTGKIPPAFEGLDHFHFAVVANMRALPPRLGEFLPVPLGPLANATTIRATVMLKQPAKIDFQMNCNSEKDAVIAEDAVRELARLARGELEKSRLPMLAWVKKSGDAPHAGPAENAEILGGLMGLTAWNQAEEILKNPPLKRQGANLTAEITAQPGMTPLLLAAGLHGTSVVVPAVGLARGASLREQGANNLKQIGLGFLLFHDKVGHFPTDITDPKTLKPLLSWRVAILPYIGQEALYKQFKLDEPWDSENNLKWAKTLVKVYAAPHQEQLADAQGRSLTHYMVFKGKATLFPADKKFTVTSIPDGTSYTFLCIEAKEPCIWTKPQDLLFDADKDFPALDSVVGLTPSGFQAVFCDGSVRWLRMDLDRKTMKCLVMPNDGATPVNLP